MTTILNASTSAGLVITPDTSGNIQLQYNGVAAPAFSAYQSSAQSVSTGTFTKVQLQSEEFDTASCFDSSTNYRFTPTVAGYYQFNGSIAIASSATYMLISFYKNGSEFKRTTYSSPSTINQIAGSALIYLNGSTDYVEMWAYLGSGQNLNTGALTTYFQGCLLRGA
jgi:hypothetical protein